MNTLKTTASILSVLFALGTTQAVHASVIQPVSPTTSQENLILVRGGGHHGGHHGHRGWHGHHGWWGHHGWHHHHGWWGGTWWGPRACGFWHHGVYYPC